MRKLFFITLLATFFSFSFTTITVHATTAGFKAGDIMDDSVMTNSNSMSVSQIQSFLNSKVPTCDTDGSAISEYGGPDLNGDGKVQRWEWGKANYGQQTFTCLKDYSQGGRSAAQIIYDAGQKYDINPQSLIVLLQKEQGLVTDTWPLNIQYRSATGYGCPDTAPCDSDYYGLTNQLDWAAKMYRSIIDQSPYWYSPYFKGVNPVVYWHPDTARCGSQSLDIKNWTTASLYSYTPYRPNQAALDAGYGIGNSCSSYGNRNFYSYFTDWFGNTQYPQPAGGVLYRQSSNGRIYLVADNKRFYVPSPSVMDQYNLDSYVAISATDNTINNFVEGGSLTSLVRDDSGNIYMVDNGTKYKFSSPSMCNEWGAECFNTHVVRNLGNTFTLNHLSVGSALSNIAKVGSAYYKIENGIRSPFADINSLNEAGYSSNQAVSLSSKNVSQPLGKLILSTPGVIKFAPKNTLYYFNGTEYLTIPGMGLYNDWRLSTTNSISAPISAYNTTTSVPSSKSLSYWYEASGGEKYVVSNSKKIKLDGNDTNLWPDATYIKGLDELAANLKTENLGGFIRSGIHVYKLVPEAGEKRYVAGMSNYRDLDITTSNTTNLNSTLAGSIKSGPFAFANGRMIKVENDTTIYVFNDDKLLHIASMPVLNSYRFDTASMRTYPVTGIDEYQKAGVLRIGKLTDGSIIIPNGRSLIKITASEVAEFGFDVSTATNISTELVKRAEAVNATKFLRNSSNGRLYYADSGSLHYISSMEIFNNLGGRSTPLTSFDNSTINLFTIGDPA